MARLTIAGWDVEAIAAARRADSEAFGPRTCGCVALLAHSERFGGGAGSTHAWPLCQHCGGLGVDLRVPGE